MTTPSDVPLEELRLRQFIESVANNPAEILARFDQIQQQADSATTNTSESPQATSSSTPNVAMDPQTIAAITNAVYTAIRANTPTTVLDPPLPAVAPTVRLSEKLPDIAEYNGDMDTLDAWEQSLIQKMYANHDRYPTDQNKINYGENRLTVGKKAHNLMNAYRVDGYCILTNFQEWRAKLRKCCGNPFEAQDARIYLRETLRQEKLPFDEYYNLFLQKKERSQMEDASLVDALQRNVNYNTQLSAMSWRTPEGQEPSTFNEWVQAYSETDNKLRQLKHRMPRAATTNTAAIVHPAKLKPLTATGQKAVSTVPVLPVAPVTSPVSAGEPMDLNSAMATVKGQKLSNPRVKDICTKWNLCFYCKLQHPGKDAKDCPNRGKSRLHLMDLTGSEGGVLLPSENA
ncbi:MAG: hypothetical protein Q9161_009767 [Pseudevernia consocians]